MTKASDYMTALNTSDINAAEAHLWARIRKLECDNEQAAARIMALEAELRGVAPSHIEQTPAGTIDWKMEVVRLNRLLAAERGVDRDELRAMNCPYRNPDCPKCNPPSDRTGPIEP